MIFTLFFILLVTQLVGQNGKITGKVIDKETNEPVPMVNILVKNTPIVVQTDMDGKYEIDIKPGEYTLEIKFIGYADVLITGVKVKKGETNTQNIILNPNVHQLDVVEVIGEKPLVDTERSASTITIDEDLIKNGTDRKLENILATQTGVIMSN
ncbi:MAG: carboxypeptidase-like regulatory domain-containing protein, partial [Bacteroidia bacterium]|nr:carboxypeptidase-like regulatory domain-containing protein [Bacteroidia bacterium]